MKKLSKREKKILHGRLLTMIAVQLSIPAKKRGDHFVSFLESFDADIEKIRQEAYEQGKADASNNNIED